MNNVNKTLYIPLYGKALVSKKGLFLNDKKAEEIWESEGFALKGKSKSKWLAYYMGIRSAVFDGWVREKLTEMPEAAVIHIGCGMDSRAVRVTADSHIWYDVDFPEVIEERGRYYAESESYKMIASDVRNHAWLEEIKEATSAIVIMEGVSMYLGREEMTSLLAALCARFGELSLLVDCYTDFAAKMSKYKNPINDVGVTEVYGIDSPELLASDALAFVKEHNMTPENFVNELHGFERLVFRKLYAGNFAKKLYKLYEYEKK